VPPVLPTSRRFIPPHLSANPSAPVRQFTTTRHKAPTRIYLRSIVGPVQAPKAIIFPQFHALTAPLGTPRRMHPLPERNTHTNIRIHTHPHSHSHTNALIYVPSSIPLSSSTRSKANYHKPPHRCHPLLNIISHHGTKKFHQFVKSHHLHSGLAKKCRVV
jgi:hypothetical protein